MPDELIMTSTTEPVEEMNTALGVKPEETPPAPASSEAPKEPEHGIDKRIGTLYVPKWFAGSLNNLQVTIAAK